MCHSGIRRGFYASLPLLIFGWASTLSAGPIGYYFLTTCLNGSCTGSSTIYRVHGNEVISWATENQGGGESVIAISEGTVKTTENYQVPTSGTGTEYSLTGAHNDGEHYTFDLSDRPNYSYTAWDGTSGGGFNYLLSWDEGGLYRFGADWGMGTQVWNLNTQPLCWYGYYDICSGYAWAGVTYDRTVANRIWVSSYDATPIPLDHAPWSSAGVVQRDLTTGLPISGFTTSFQLGGLAMDDDGTLWVANNSTERGYIYHYGRDGTFLDKMQFYSGAGTIDVMGGEIADHTLLDGQGGQVPEPNEFLMLAVCLVLLVPLGRKMRKTSPVRDH